MRVLELLLQGVSIDHANREYGGMTALHAAVAEGTYVYMLYNWVLSYAVCRCTAQCAVVGVEQSQHGCC